MKITCISDLHGHEPELPGGDLLLLPGDVLRNSTPKQVSKFFSWLKRQNYSKKVVIGGNHDYFFMSGCPMNQKEADDLKELQTDLIAQGEIEAEDFEYLCDSGTEFMGMKIWGSPWTSRFVGMNFRCCAFTVPNDDFLVPHWNMIPEETDILITHSPPYGILDDTMRGEFCGSISLKNKIIKLQQLKLHAFGHIHEQGGKRLYMRRAGYGVENNIHLINAAYCDLYYQPKNPIMEIEL
jgi:predicted phosphohydrolase